MHRFGGTDRFRPPRNSLMHRMMLSVRHSSRIRKANRTSAVTKKNSTRDFCVCCLFYIFRRDQPITRIRITPSIAFMVSAIAAASAPVTSIMVYA